MQLEMPPRESLRRLPLCPVIVLLCVVSTLALGTFSDDPLPRACSDAETEMIPLRPTNVEGKWNLIAMAYADQVWYEYFQHVCFLWDEIAIIGNKISITSFFGLVGLTNIYSFRGVKSSQDEASITFTEESAFAGVKLTQPRPGSLAITEYEHGFPVGVLLFSRRPELPAEDVKTFSAWTSCANYSHFLEFKNAINYASVCPDVLILEKLPDEEPIEGRWPLVAKATNAPDKRYLLRNLYSARLDFSISKKSYAVKETLVTLHHEQSLNDVHRDGEGRPNTGEGRPDTADCSTRVLHFKSKEDTLLLGVEKICRGGTQATLYFSAMSGKVKKSASETFKLQALCYSATHVYLIPQTQEP